jgi:transposase
MTNSLPIPDELWKKIPPDLQAAVAAVIFAMQQQISDLDVRVRDLEARLKLNSTNSSKPPSTDPLAWMPTEAKLVNTTTRLDPVIPHACVSF